MTDITPADLARFVHRVPVGAIIPAGTEFAYSAARVVCVPTPPVSAITQTATCVERWTAEPIPAPEPTLAERVRALLGEPTADWSPAGVRLIRIVAEMAERIEAKP